MFIDQSNSRLNRIFTLWFLAVAILPSLLVGLASYSLQRDQLFEQVEHELSTVARIKESQMQLFVESEQSSLKNALRGMPELIASLGTVDSAIRSTVEDSQSSSVMRYYVSASGTVFVPNGTTVSLDVLWKPQGDSLLYGNSDSFFVAEPSNFPSGWLISVLPQETVSAVLHEDINDSKFFSHTNADGATYGVGRTADMVLVDGSGNTLTASLTREAAGSVLQDKALVGWIQSSQVPTLLESSVIGARSIVLHARRISLADTPVAMVVSIDSSEVMGRLYSNQRNLLVLFLLSLIVILVILYLFVGNVSRLVIRPIYGSIGNLGISSTRLKGSVANTEEIVHKQQQVATSLTENYKDQLRDIKKVDAAINTIVASLRSIGRQTKISAKSVTLIDDLAVKSQKEAKVAGDQVKSIERLAVAHDVLAESLNAYNQEVDAIAQDVKKISKAITYLSLNAGIEADKSDRSLSSLSGIVSEVGKLSRLSNSASERINDLVSAIQKQLQEAKKSAAKERNEAKSSTEVINQALASLSKMSRDTVKISKSVKMIDSQVSKQAESAYQIVVQSTDLMKEAKSNMRETVKLNNLSSELKKSVKSYSGVVRKLASSISRLSELIGLKKKNGS